MSVTVLVPPCNFFIGDGWRLLVEGVLREIAQWRTENLRVFFGIRGWTMLNFYSINHQTSRSRITKPPGSGGQVIVDR